jgi:hypothetical protein
LTIISLVDRTTQYFLAGAIRRNLGTNDELSIERAWFGYESIPTPGGLCEVYKLFITILELVLTKLQNTLAVDCTAGDYPCFTVNDLEADERFAKLPVVDGTLSSYRFYAGTPITTAHGINIGSLFMFDDRPRPNGLALDQRKCKYSLLSDEIVLLSTSR